MTIPRATTGGGLALDGVSIEEGSNATMGQATLTAGAVTVTTNRVAANSRIFVSRQTLGGTAGHLDIGTITAGTSFTIESSSGTDTSVVNWWIISPV